MKAARPFLVDLDSFDGPIALADAVNPLLKEIVPGVFGVSFQLALEVGNAKDAVLVLSINALHELQKRGFPEPLLDEPDDFAAAIVGGRGQVSEVRSAEHTSA